MKREYINFWITTEGLIKMDNVDITQHVKSISFSMDCDNLPEVAIVFSGIKMDARIGVMPCCVKQKNII